MKKYKIIASDLDGTLLNSNSKISKENIEAINKLYEKGIVFVPCTGRTYSEIPEEIKNMSSNRYTIYSNGAVVYDKKSGRHIKNCISNDIARKIMEFISSYEVHIAYRQNGELFVDANFQEDNSFKYYNVITPHQVVIRDFANHLNNFENTIHETEDIEVFSVFFHNYRDKIYCRELIEQTGKVKTVEASEYNLEIMNIDAGKGKALHSLADMLNISHKETIGIGDSDNDASLINVAGLGLAVANSCESLKKIADEIICSNDENIVRYVLNHYI